MEEDNKELQLKLEKLEKKRAIERKSQQKRRAKIKEMGLSEYYYEKQKETASKYRQKNALSTFSVVLNQKEQEILKELSDSFNIKKADIIRAFLNDSFTKSTKLILKKILSSLLT